MCPYTSVDCANSGECEKQKKEYPEEWLIPINPEAKRFERKLKRQIKGALKACINDHGPVTANLIGSVLKRLENQPEYKRLIDQWTPSKNTPLPENFSKEL